MALKSPLMPSPTGNAMSSAFSPYSDSPNSPARFNTHTPHSNRSSGQADSLAPPSPYPQHTDPSPVDSNGTESTEIEEGEQEGIKSKSTETITGIGPGSTKSPDIEVTSPAASDNRPTINTRLPASRRRADSAEDGPQSVIHVPSGFKKFDDSQHRDQFPASPPGQSVASPATPEAIGTPAEQKQPTPVKTDVPRYMDRSTPRAQTKHDSDEDHRRRSIRSSSLEDIPESLDKDGNEQMGHSESLASPISRPATATQIPALGSADTESIVDSSVEAVLQQADEEVEALRSALGECWTLCNTLSGLSSGHRQRTFQFTGQTEAQEHAWRSCWRLCQNLYANKDKHADDLEVVSTLELCRDFCQSLFDVRQRIDETTDSVLRVSFELNNHLYNTHGRIQPDAFNERTLDFYVTLCHRLMKPRTTLPQETDVLLRACWYLAEMLFNMRQANREGRPADEELLSSAVQACWDLCDLFRVGWSQVRPDRNTPRPSQQTFASQVSVSFRSDSSASGRQSRASTLSNHRNNSSASNRYADRPEIIGPAPPETPITIFDDTSTTDNSPDTPNVPNILVLGPGSNARSNSRSGHRLDRWSSAASSLSDDSFSSAGDRSSQRSGSTATASGEEAQLLSLRYLLLKAGMTTGYSRGSSQQLPSWVQGLPKDAFGPASWQVKVLVYYKKLVTHDKSMATAHTLPAKRLSPGEAARAVAWLGSAEQWAWMRDLFRLVFGFGVEEAERRGGMALSV